MRRAKGVVFTLGALRKTTQATELAQGVHAVTPTGQNFVGIGLVAHVPHNAIVRRVVDIVQRHGEFHGAEIGAEMPAGLGNAFQQIGAQLIGQLAQLPARHVPQVAWIIDGLQQGIQVFRHNFYFNYRASVRTIDHHICQGAQRTSLRERTAVQCR